MDTPSMIDVLVVGAGPVGLTLAIDLARRGVTCRIIEQSPTYQVGTRGRGISLRTQQVFEDLGILEALFSYDEGLAPTRTYDQGKLVHETNPASLFPPVPPPYRPILMINQEHTEAVLRERLASYNQQVELGTQLLNFTGYNIPSPPRVPTRFQPGLHHTRLRQGGLRRSFPAQHYLPGQFAGARPRRHDWHSRRGSRP